MSAKTEANIAAGVNQNLGPDEHVTHSLIASVRGHQQAMTGGIGGAVGGSRAKRARADAAAAGINFAGVMALALTERRLLVAEVGNAGKVKRLLNTFDLEEVGLMTVRRLGLGGVVTIQIRSVDVRLESRVGASWKFHDALLEAKAARLGETYNR